MKTAMTTADIRFESIDDCLGPGEKRFFGEGFKRVAHQITDVSVIRQDEGTGYVQASASLRYPVDWSRKSADVELRPHLSTIDALLLGVQLGEIYLTHAYGLDGVARQKMWLRRLAMRAGTTPQEDLAEFRIRADHSETRTVPDTLCGHVSSFACLIGTVRIRFDIEHGMGPVSSRDGFYPAAEDILGPGSHRYYGEGYKLRKQIIKALELDLENQRLEALVKISGETENLPGHGLAAHYHPTLSMIDCLAAMSQTAQVLLYELDGVKRSSTNTLWMRKVVMESRTPYQPLFNPFMVSAAVTSSRLLNLAGGSWRVADMAGHFQGVQVEASLAHELPKDGTAGDPALRMAAQ
jgi:hypothetical protein